MIMFVASYETRHFTFEGVGRDEATAIDVLKRGLETHAAQFSLPPDWYGDDTFNVRAYSGGAAYRDGEPLQA